MATAKKLPSGSWRIQIYLGKDDDGKPIRKSFTARTKREAEYAAAMYAAGRRMQTSPENMTVGEAIDQYISSQTNILSPSTVVGYKSIRRSALQELMPVKLSRLRQADVTRAVNVRALTHSPKSVRNAYGLLTAALAVYAPDLRLNTPLPKPVRKEISIPDQEQVAALMDYVRGTPLEIPVVLAACLGLRRSEICGLMGTDVDTAEKTITIRRALVINDKGQLVFKSPKSYAGTRTLTDVAPSILLLLKPYEGKEERIVTITPKSVTKRFGAAARELGIPVTFHGLRHYNASVMLALGVPDKYAMERLGQSTPGVLKRVYQHIMADKRTEIAGQMKAAAEAILGGNAHKSAHIK